MRGRHSRCAAVAEASTEGGDLLRPYTAVIAEPLGLAPYMDLVVHAMPQSGNSRLCFGACLCVE